jgi:hypothetical protein
MGGTGAAHREVEGMNSPLPIAAEHADWLHAFREVHGRTPRVLHIGNIANNAYLNSKILNRAGVESDVLCYNYYHVMSWPEWEDSDFAGDVEDQAFPAWERLDTGGFERPRWFAQGPVDACAEYLKARRDGRRHQAEWWWAGLAFLTLNVCARVRRARAASAERAGVWSEPVFQHFSDLYWPCRSPSGSVESLDRPSRTVPAR